MPRQRQSVMGLGIILLVHKLFNTGLRHIPPVTLLCILGQTLLFMGIFNPPWDRYEVCLSAESILIYADYRRLILAAIEHADDFHLYHNMASFILKGRTLERRYGTLKYVILLLVFTLSTSVTYVALAKIAYAHFDDYSYMKQCCIGFSGVLFALKVLTTFESGDREHLIHGFLVPSKYVVWVELLVIHMLVPKASFMGHLAGILVGILYIKGPLKWFVNGIADTLNSFNSSEQPPNGGNYTYDHGFARPHNYNEREPPNYGWNTGNLPPNFPNANNENVRFTPDASLGNSGFISPDPEELRRRRMHRFN